MDTPLVKDMDTPLVKDMDTPLVTDMNTPLVKDMNTPLVKDMDTPLVKDMVSRKRKADSIDLDESSSSSGSSRKRRKCSENALRHMTLFDSSDESWDDEKFEEYYQTVHMNTPTSVVPPANPDEIKFLHNYKLSNISMCLRKIINHPYLVKKPFKEINGVKEMVTDENIITKCGKMIVLNQLLAKLKETNHKVLVFSTMTKALDMIEEMCILKDYQYYRLDGTVNNELRNKSIDDFNNPKTGWSVFLISTRAGMNKFIFSLALDSLT
uniref:Probable global transcription activator SNF2L1 n=1 Tax=Cacopsylla melanoneura TaxID=428564 RepID=A0A8D8WKV8_9HEMI